MQGSFCLKFRSKQAIHADHISLKQVIELSVLHLDSSWELGGIVGSLALKLW